MRSRRGLWITLAAAGVVLVVVVLAVAVPRWSGPAPVTVMTRNVYLGADLNRSISAGSGLDSVEQQRARALANDEVRAIVDRTDFGVRSRLVAAEIAATRPDLVGLQEVALWRQGPLEHTTFGQPDATAVDYDFLELLLTELNGLGLHYEVVQVQQVADVEGRAYSDSWDFRNGRDVRLTLRDVILVHAGSGITVRERGGGLYWATRLGVFAAESGSDLRGFAWADVEVGGTRFRFITTHLESASPEAAQAQAAELLALPVTATADPVIIAGDLNADPDPPDPAYAVLTGAGFADTWPADAGPGFTFGLSETVNDEVPSFDRRIDYVLVRGLSPEQLERTEGELTGDQLTDRDPATGLWPSDHAGVVVRLAIG